jgi:PilZ domain
MSDERRVHPRAPGVLEGTWSGSLRRCRITTLSVAGCFVESPTTTVKGAKVRLEIDLPDQGTVSVEGEVVYSDQMAMGFSVRFVDLTPETREQLARAVEALFIRSKSGQNPQ